MQTNICQLQTLPGTNKHLPGLEPLTDLYTTLQATRWPGANKYLQHLHKQTFTGGEPLTHFKHYMPPGANKHLQTFIPTNTYKHKQTFTGWSHLLTLIQHYKPPGANKDLQTFIQKQTFTGVEPLTHFNTTLHATRCKQTCKTSTPTNTYKHKLNLQVRRRSHLITLTQHCHQVQKNIYKNKHLQTLANIWEKICWPYRA